MTLVDVLTRGLPQPLLAEEEREHRLAGLVGVETEGVDLLVGDPLQDAIPGSGEHLLQAVDVFAVVGVGHGHANLYRSGPPVSRCRRGAARNGRRGSARAAVLYRGDRKGNPALRWRSEPAWMGSG